MRATNGDQAPQDQDGQGQDQNGRNRQHRAPQENEQFCSLTDESGEEVTKTKDVGIRRGLNSGFLSVNHQRGLDILCPNSRNGQILAIIKIPQHQDTDACPPAFCNNPSCGLELKKEWLRQQRQQLQ